MQFLIHLEIHFFKNNLCILRIGRVDDKEFNSAVGFTAMHDRSSLNSCKENDVRLYGIMNNLNQYPIPSNLTQDLML